MSPYEYYTVKRYRVLRKFYGKKYALGLLSNQELAALIAAARER